MKRKLILFYSTLVGFLCFNLISCTEIDLSNISKDVQIKESLVVPLGEGSITLADLLKSLGQNYSNSADANAIEIKMSDSLEVSFPTLDLSSTFSPFNFTFTPFPTNFTLTPPYVFPVIGTTANLNLGLNTDVSKQRIDSVWIKSLDFSFILNSNILSAGNYTIRLTFPGNKLKYRDGTVISKDIKPDNFNVAKVISLQNVVLYTNGGTSVLPLKAEIIVTSGNTNLNVGPSSQISLTTEIKAFNFDVAFGLFNPQTIAAQPLQIPFDINTILGELPKGIKLGLKFANPKIDLQLTSNVGTFLKFNIDHVRALIKENPTVNVDANFGGSTSTSETLARPSLTGTTVHNFKQLNKDWGGTNNLFDLTKNYNLLEYKFTLENDMDSINAHLQSPCFVKADTKVKAKFAVTIPFSFDNGTYISATDTIKNIGELMNKIDKATLALKVTNGLPVNVVYKMKFLNASNNPILNAANQPVYNDSTVINSAAIKTDGFAGTPTISSINIALDAAQTALLKNATSMIYSVRIAPVETIQFSRTDSIKVKIGVFMNGTFNTTIK